MDELGDTKEGKECPYIISFLTEFMGTAILLHMGCMGCVVDVGLGPTLPAFTFGAAILAAVQIFGHISPCHINPCVSLGILILGKMNWKKFLVYIVAQYLGSIFGYISLKLIMPQRDHICLLTIHNGVSIMQGFLVEFGCTFVLMMVVAGAIDIKNERFGDSISIRFGLVVVGLVFAAEPFTGAGLNSARSIGPPLFSGKWDDHWVYEVAPFTGMAVAATLYRFVLDPNEKYSLYKLLEKKGL